MATQIRDLLGRISTAGNDIGKYIESMLSSGTKLISQSPSPNNDKIEELVKIMESLDKNYEKYQKDDEKRVREIIKAVEEIQKEAKNSRKDSKTLSDIEKGFVKLEKTISSGLSDISSNLSSALKNGPPNQPKDVGNIGGPPRKGGGGGGGGGGKGGSGKGGGGGPFFPDDKSISESAKRAHSIWFNTFQRDSRRSVAAWVSGIATALTGGFDPWQVMFDNLMEDATIFRKEMRKIAFETQGITGDMRDLQAQFIEIGTQAATTGVHLNAFQTAYLKNLKKGIKDQRETIKVLKTGLHTATMLGANAENTADMFHDWHMQMGLNNNQLSQVSRNLQDVARLTGVTGDELMGIVKNSEKFVKNMRNAGTLTAAAVKQITILAAEAQKLGVAEQMDPFLDAITSGTNLLLEADDKTRTLAFMVGSSVGKVAEIMNGTIMQTRQGAKDLATGLENTIERFAKMSMEQLDELTKQAQAGDMVAAERLRSINLAMKSATGRTVDEMKRMFEAASKSGMSLNEQLKEYDDKLRNTNLTVEESLKLEKDRQQALMNTGFAFLDKFDQQASAAGITFEEAARRAAENLNPDELTDLQSLAKEMGMSMTSATDKWMVAGLSTAKQLKEAGGQDFTANIEKAMKSGDIKATREILSQMSEEQQKLGIEQKKGVDPIEDIAQTVMQINENLRGWFSGPMGEILDALGKYGILALQLTLMASVLWNAFGGGGGGIFGKMLGKIAGLFGTGEKGKGLLDAAGAGAGKAGAGKKGGSFANFEVPQFDSGKMKKAGTNLAKGAVGLASLVVGIMALAAVIMTIGSGLLAITGLDADKTKEIGITVATLIGAAALIAGVSVIAAKGLEKVSEMSRIIPKVYKGALVLLALIPAMMLLGGAVLGMGAILTAFVTPEWAIKVAEAVKQVLLSAAEISLGILLMSGGLAALGKLAMMAPILAPLILIGAAVMVGLSAVVMTMAAAIMGMGALIEKAFPLEYAVKIQKSLEAVFSTAVLVGQTILFWGPMLAALGGLGLIGLIVIAAMAIGVVVFKKMSDVIVKFVEVLMGLGKKIAGIVTPKETEEIATALENVGKMAKGVADAVKSMQEDIAPLADSWPFFDSPIEDLAEALPVFEKYFVAVADFFRFGIIEPIKMYFDGVDLSGAEKAITAMGSAANNLKSVLEASDYIIEWTDTGRTGLFDSKAEDLEEALPTFAKFFDKVASFFRFGIIEPAMLHLDGLGDFERVEKVMKAMGSTADSVKSILESSDFILEWTDTGWTGLFDSKAEDLEEALPTFEKFFSKVADFFKFGIVEPIKLYFPEAEQARTAVDQLEKSGEILGKSADVLDVISKDVVRFTDGWAWTVPIASLESETRTFGKYFSGIGSAIKTGIVDPVKSSSFVSVEALQKTAEKLRLLAEIMQTIAEVMQSLSDITKEMQQTGATDITKMQQIIQAAASLQGAFASGRAAEAGHLNTNRQIALEGKALAQEASDMQKAYDALNGKPGASNKKVNEANKNMRETTTVWGKEITDSYVDAQKLMFTGDHVNKAEREVTAAKVIAQKMQQQILSSIYKEGVVEVSDQAKKTAIESLESVEKNMTVASEKSAESIKKTWDSISKTKEAEKQVAKPGTEDLSAGAEKWLTPAGKADEFGVQQVGHGTDKGLMDLWRSSGDPMTARHDAFLTSEKAQAAEWAMWAAQEEAKNRGKGKLASGGGGPASIDIFTAARKILQAEQASDPKNPIWRKKFSEYLSGLRQAETQTERIKIAQSVIDEYGGKHQDITSLIKEYGNALGGVGFTNGPTAYIAGERGKERVTIERVRPGGLTELEERTAELIERAIPTAFRSSEEGDVSRVQPVHLRDIAETILRDKVSSEAGSSSLKSDELARIDEASQRQVDELVEIRESMQELVSIFKQSGPIGNPPQEFGSTKVRRRPKPSPNYGNMKYGKPGQSANRQIITDGES